jgi:hypothetical protein
MTTNQLIAMGFPLLTAAAVGLTGLFVRKPWLERTEPKSEAPDVYAIEITEVSQHLARARILIDEAERELHPSQPKFSPF